MLSQPSWRPESVLRMLAGIFACMLAGTLLIAAFNKLFVETGRVTEDQAKFFNLTVGMISFNCGILILAQWLVWEHGVTWGQAFGFRLAGLPNALALAAIVAVFAVPLSWLLGEFSGWVMLQLHREVVAQPAVETLRKAVTTWQKIEFGVMAIAVAPFTEEVLFRGILYPAVRQFGRPRASMWIISFLFAAYHASWMTLLPLTILAVILTLLYERTQTLAAPILCHSLFNLTNFIYLMHESGGFPR
ncbi:MAG TPA: CPBP family intramembrane glutamic endopeptidase [Verrucomicrobiae bacterium]|nr:CPBP family intramembrane glutamic endopeptidase [Verrucomicrobiae bacterium]